MGRSGEWSWSATWLPSICNNLIYRVPGIRRSKPSNLLLYAKSCEFEETIHRTWNVLTGIRFLTPICSCVAESTDNRPRDLYWCSSLGMYLVYFLYESRCLWIDLSKINCCLNVLFNVLRGREFFWLLLSFTFLNPKILGFLLPTKASLTWGVKCEKLDFRKS